MIIGKYTLIRFLKKPIPLICACVIPVVMMFIPALWEWENMGGLGLLAFVVMGSGFITSQTILTDRLDGTITRIMTAPVTMTRYLAENLVACALPIWIQLVLVTGVGMVFYDWSLSFALPLLLIYGVFAFSAVALAFMWYGFMKSKDSSTAGLSLLVTVMAMFGGMLFPLDQFPQWVEWVGRAFPVYWLVQGYEALAAEGVPTGDYWLSLGIVIAFTLLFLGVGGQRRKV